MAAAAPPAASSAAAAGDAMLQQLMAKQTAAERRYDAAVADFKAAAAKWEASLGTPNADAFKLLMDEAKAIMNKAEQLLDEANQAVEDERKRPRSGDAEERAAKRRRVENDFLVKSKDGRFFAGQRESEVPQKCLTPAEVEQRRKWGDIRASLASFAAAEPETVGEMLDQLVVAPRLALAEISSRSGKTEQRGRLYPPGDNVRAWDGFVVPTEHKRDDDAVEGRRLDAFRSSLFDGQEHRREEAETAFMQKVVLEHLRVARFAAHTDAASVGGVSVASKPDTMLYFEHGGELKNMAVLEMKSSHNLLLDDSAEDVAKAYKKGYDDVTIDAERATDWVHTAHPLGQVVRQMVDNGLRYGVLSSATRTFFVHLCTSEAGEDREFFVEVSRAWFVGEPLYFRAWAHFLSLARESALGLRHGDQKLTMKDAERLAGSWKGRTPVGSRRPSNTRQGKGRRCFSISGSGGGNDEGAGGAHSDAAAVPHVPFSSVQLVRVIGTGRHGAVHLAVWEGREVALKLFDVDHGAEDAWVRELEAYTRLRDAWGELVPRPAFTSQSVTGAVWYLGLQLGRREPRDTALGATFYDDQQRVLDALRARFGFEHLDAEPRNFVYVDGPDERERLVALDLEEYELVCAEGAAE